MKLVVALSLALAGCVVAPLDPQVSVGVRINYPVAVSAYIFDPRVQLYYFEDRGQRHYMPRGWHHKHGVPPGHYRGNKQGGKWKHD